MFFLYCIIESLIDTSVKILQNVVLQYFKISLIIKFYSHQIAFARMVELCLIFYKALVST